MHIYTIFALALAMPAIAHMDLSDPVPFRSPQNPHITSGSGDYSMTSPLKSDGSDFPCKLYHKDMGTEAGASVATWIAGENQTFSISGGASHNGGSCQVSLSYDAGKSFTVIHSYVGACPTATGGTFGFKVPQDAPSGAAIFAWTWFNQIGNREMYMNCASVTISPTSKVKRDSQVAFKARPSIAVMNLNNGCTTPAGFDVCYEFPGPDTTEGSTQPHSQANYPIGECKPVNGIGTNSGSAAPSASSIPSSASSSQGSSLASLSSSIGTPSSPSGFVTSYTSNSASSISSSYTAPTNSPISNSTLSPDGSCSGIFSCNGSPSGSCCSSFGWCGVTEAHCGEGCNPLKGTCGIQGTSIPASSSATASYELANSTLSTIVGGMRSTDLAGKITVIPIPLSSPTPAPVSGVSSITS